MEGWVKLHRVIFENGLWKTPFDLRLFLWLFGNAVFDANGLKYGNIKINRGQYLRSYRKLQDDLEYIENNKVKIPSLSTLNRSIERLIKGEMIATLETELGTLFTIINYEKYQLKDDKNETFSVNQDDIKTGLGTGAWNSSGTAAEQQRNNNKNVKNDKKLITLSGLLIESINKESSLYSIIGKYKKLIGEDKLKGILADLVKRDNKFKDENKLAAYLETCKNKDNQSGKITDKLKELTGAEDGYI